MAGSLPVLSPRYSKLPGTIFRLVPLSGIEAEARVLKMFEAGPSMRIVPYGADQTLFVVVDRVGAAREIRIERPDLESTIRDLVAGCFCDPAGVIAFNTLEHWVQDVSATVALEIQSRCDMEGAELPGHLRDFVESHTCLARPITSSAELSHAGAILAHRLP